MTEVQPKRVAIEILAPAENHARHQIGLALVTQLLKSKYIRVDVFFYADAVDLLLATDDDMLSKWQALGRAGNLQVTVCQTALERRQTCSGIDLDSQLPWVQQSTLMNWLNTVIHSDRHLVL